MTVLHQSDGSQQKIVPEFYGFLSTLNHVISSLFVDLHVLSSSNRIGMSFS